MLSSNGSTASTSRFSSKRTAFGETGDLWDNMRLLTDSERTGALESGVENCDNENAIQDIVQPSRRGGGNVEHRRSETPRVSTVANRRRINVPEDIYAEDEDAHSMEGRQYREEKAVPFSRNGKRPPPLHDDTARDIYTDDNNDDTAQIGTGSSLRKSKNTIVTATGYQSKVKRNRMNDYGDEEINIENIDRNTDTVTTIDGDGRSYSGPKQTHSKQPLIHSSQQQQQSHQQQQTAAAAAAAAAAQGRYIMQDPNVAQTWKDATKAWTRRTAPQHGSNRMLTHVAAGRKAMNDAMRMCEPLDSSLDRTCWSLLTRLDVNKCARDLRVTAKPELVASLNRLICKINDTLCRLSKCANTRKTSVNISTNMLKALPQWSNGKNRRSDVDKATINAIRSNDATSNGASLDVVPTIASDEEENDDSTAPPVEEEDILDLVAILDGYLQAFVASTALRRQAPFGSFLKNRSDDDTPFASVNCVLGDEHLEHMRQCLRQNGHSTNGEFRHRLGGYYLISLTRREAAKNMKFPILDDMSKVLQEVARRFIVHDMFAEYPQMRNTKVFLNLSSKVNVVHFNVLRETVGTTATLETTGNGTNGNNGVGGDEYDDGTLALVEMAYAEYNQEKNIITVKGYVVATYGSTDSPVALKRN